ncbi:MAG: integrase family protein [Pseudomonadota bacterium]
MRLTDVAIRQLALVESGQKRYRDDVVPGFGITVGTNRKTFFVMYGRERRLRTLGQWPDVSLKQARQEARQVLAHQLNRKRTVSFGEARQAFLDDCTTRLRQTTIDRYYYSLKTIEAKTLESVSTDVTDPNHLKALKVFYNWCIDHQLIDHNPFIRRKVVFGKRERVLTDEEVKALWQYEHEPYSHMVKALLLTGQRRNQIWRFQAEWIEGDEITFPSSIMKSKRTHTLPLTGYERYLGETRFNSWSKAKVRIDQHTEVNGWVIHDLRRYFSTTMAKIGTPLHVTEQIMDHRSTLSGVAAVYNRYDFMDEMREALANYHQHIETVVASA